MIKTPIFDADGVVLQHKILFSEGLVRDFGTSPKWDDKEKNIASAKEAGFQAETYTDFELYKKKTDSLLK
jgi:hypothetical protein